MLLSFVNDTKTALYTCCDKQMFYNIQIKFTAHAMFSFRCDKMECHVIYEHK